MESANPSRSLKIPLLGTLLAILITTTFDATGLTAFSAIPLLPLLGFFWYVERHTRRNMGFVWGPLRYYGLALIYPNTVMGALLMLAAFSGALDFSKTDWQKAGLNLVLITTSTILVAILTEEGFFRGWLWASLEKAGLQKSKVLVCTSLAFCLWHVSVVTLKTGFELPGWQIPLYLINVAFIGAVWGWLRLNSGSVVVASVSHGLWNGMAYTLFGYGTKVGALGIRNTSLYGPEVGLVGVILNFCFLLVLLRLGNRSKSCSNGSPFISGRPGSCCL